MTSILLSRRDVLKGTLAVAAALGRYWQRYEVSPSRSAREDCTTAGAH